MAECNGCEYGARIKALEKAADANIEQHEKMHGRIGVLETQNGITNNQFHQIMGALKEMKAEIKETNEEIKEIRNTPPKDIEDLKRDMKEIKDKPGKRIDTIITVAITAAVSCVIGAIITFLLQNIK